MADNTFAILLFDQTKGKITEVAFAKTASIYTCGITPYDASHLGHVATFTYFDVLVRLLKEHDIDVTLVRNVTDLDDPLFERVRKSGEPLDELVKRNVEKLDADLEMLNCIKPTFEPYSSSFVEQIIEAITKLIEQGFAYTVDGWTYFDISKREQFPEFENLLNLKNKELVSIAAQRGADIDDSRLRSRLDFVLWKPSLEDEPSFDAPFGKGRPGWHIECSVMATELLGETIDIHGGGDDLIFPHHACEVAQSESLTGKKFVRHFMHVAPVSYEGEKMSKSLGNLVYANEIIHDIGEMCTRMMLLAHHYREGFEHHASDAKFAQNRCATWGEAIRDFNEEPKKGDVYEKVCTALCNDLDTPKALKIIDEAISTLSEDGNQDLIADICSAKDLMGFR